MKAAEFHEHFERAFIVASLPANLERLKGKLPKWKHRAPQGTVTFRFGTNARAAGLLPLLWPGEFRPVFRWQHGSSGRKEEEDVSFFQYADIAKAEAAVELQRAAIGKYLRNRFEDLRERDHWINKYGPFDVPVPNIERWFHYFDAEDASAWGEYFGSYMATWTREFDERPESLHAWSCRVLWKNVAKVES